MRKKILIINQAQFGYQMDYLQYSKYLKKNFEITFLCWNYQWKIIEEEGVHVHYISRGGNTIIRNFRFIRTVITFLNKTPYFLTFIHYFRGCLVIPLLFKNKSSIHLDIRSGSISPGLMQRTLYNFILRIESSFFRRISIISEGLKEYLKIKKSAYILPLGAENISVERKPNHKISLLYVGTLSNRRIEKTILGFKIFLENTSSKDISYTIIGRGWGNELQLINDLVKQYGLEEYIFIKGYIPSSELISYYSKANVGVSFIPITPYYNYQPATKTFEYLMAGMPVIATETYENRKVINEDNGFLIDDTPDSFAECITKIEKCIHNYDEERIKNTISNYQWKNIISKMENECINRLEHPNLKDRLEL